MEKIIQQYWVIEPYARATILQTDEGFFYRLEEPPLSVVEQKLLAKLKRRIYEITPTKTVIDSPQAARKLLEENVLRVLEMDDMTLKAEKKSSATRTKLAIGDAFAWALASIAHLLRLKRATAKKARISLPPDVVGKLQYYVVRDFLGLGRIEPLIWDPNVEDVTCNKSEGPVFVYHQSVEYVPTNVSYPRDELDDFVFRLAGLGKKHISSALPSVDVAMPGGLRGQLCYLEEISPHGSNFTIRKWREVPISITELIRGGTISVATAAYLWFMIQHRSSVVVGGIVASGKTTALNTFANFIPEHAKVATCEDTRELRLPHKNWSAAVTRPGGLGGGSTREVDLFALVKNTLRQRPDYVLVGEIRGSEAYALFQSASAGQLALTTFHASDAETMLQRLQSAPMNVPIGLLVCINVIVMMRKITDPQGLPARRAVQVVEVLGYDDDRKAFVLNPIFQWDVFTDTFLAPSEPQLTKRIAAQYGYSVEQVKAELARRTRFLEDMSKKGVTDHEAVSHLTWLYARNPEKAIATLNEVELRPVVPLGKPRTEADENAIFVELERCYRARFGASWEENLYEESGRRAHMPITSKTDPGLLRHVLLHVYDTLMEQERK